jgi:hypothetical protein
LSPSYLLGVKFSLSPSILLNTGEGSPLGVNEGVNLPPRGQSSPLGPSSPPRGEVHPWWPGMKLRMALSLLFFSFMDRRRAVARFNPASRGESQPQGMLNLMGVINPQRRSGSLGAKLISRAKLTVCLYILLNSSVRSPPGVK